MSGQESSHRRKIEPATQKKEKGDIKQPEQIKHAHEGISSEGDRRQEVGREGSHEQLPERPRQCLEACLAPHGSIPHTSHGNNSTASDQMPL